MKATKKGTGMFAMKISSNGTVWSTATHRTTSWIRTQGGVCRFESAESRAVRCDRDVRARSIRTGIEFMRVALMNGVAS